MHLKHCRTKTDPLISAPFNLLHPRLPLFNDWHLRSPSYSHKTLDSSPFIASHMQSSSKSFSSTFKLASSPVLHSSHPGKTPSSFAWTGAVDTYHFTALLQTPWGIPHILSKLTSKLLTVAYRCLQSVGSTLTPKSPTEGSWPGVFIKGSCPRELPSR